MVIHPGQHNCPVEEQAERLSRMIWADSVNHFAEWLQSCRDVFNAFHHCLVRHIGFEESVEVHNRLVETRPERRTQVLNLCREHQRMLSECAHLQQQLSESPESDSLYAREIIRRLENLIALFRRHESEERRLVREVFGHADGRCLLAELEPPLCPHRAGPTLNRET